MAPVSSSRTSTATSSHQQRMSQGHHHQPARSKVPGLKRSVTPNSRASSSISDSGDEDSGRVRVAVRLRPRNAEELLSDADFADCVELQPELKRLKLRKNNWSSESYRFDEVFTEDASQRRVYEVVAKPVVEGVLNGYNGTVMAYGQTGSGKTYTLGRLGKDDASKRGIMIRSLEDIIANTSHASDTVDVSYLQLYMESLQDLLAPEKVNIPICEDPKTGDVTVPGATVARVRDVEHFRELLQIGEANRHAANTKLNTESSRSHAILMVNVRRCVQGKKGDAIEITHQERGRTNLPSADVVPRIQKSKLLIVDLAGSERVDKSGSEGHLLEEAKFINLSLTSLGKCINALAENSSHIPTRDSKLTRLLRDSFGGSARTSLIVTIGPSSRHHAETTSTIMFGQRAMKIVNVLKLKEEFDYESLCHKLWSQIDHLTAETERLESLRAEEKIILEKQLKDQCNSFSEREKDLIKRSELLEMENNHLGLEMKDIVTELNRQKEHNDFMHKSVLDLQINLNNVKEQWQQESSTYKNVLADTTQTYEKKIMEVMEQLEGERSRASNAEEQLVSFMKLSNDNRLLLQQQAAECSSYQNAIADTTNMYEKKITNLKMQLVEEKAQYNDVKEQLDLAKKLLSDQQSFVQGKEDFDNLTVKLQDICKLHEDCNNELQFLKADYDDLLMEKAKLYEELHNVRQRLEDEEKQKKIVENELARAKKVIPENQNDYQGNQAYLKENIGKGSSMSVNSMGLHKLNPLRETQTSQRTTIAKICEEVGLEKILALLASEDLDVQIHAVKVVANLAAEDIHQEKIVEGGGLDALLLLLKSSHNVTILRVASGAIANLAMSEVNQGLIISKGGAQLLASIASKTDDLQTLRMVAGAIANLCGNEKLLYVLKEDGAIKALLGMVRSRNPEVVAQVARGIANFAKCESRAILQGYRKGRSLLIEDDVLPWLIDGSNITSASIRRHIELAICHLAQNQDNAQDFISSGAAKELRRICHDSSREDIRNLAKKTLKFFPEMSS
ncbi:hypothetical protein SAY86_009505 [Trapa natans]|uniref:Kinesin motor domain-containing protein n=1 Tax=Trapa natans TaxID=22666 RepID=A0AAN7KWY7_TRANT|nr:hypothetical protein SAY86_009505 [Trapa natans]